MEIYKSCPECSSRILVDSTSCRCGWSLKGVATKGKPTLCGFETHGRQCVHVGVLSDGTSGDGSWYCREHWEVVNGRKPVVQGNAIPPSGRSPVLKLWDPYEYDAENKRYVPKGTLARKAAA